MLDLVSCADLMTHRLSHNFFRFVIVCPFQCSNIFHVVSIYVQGFVLCCAASLLHLFLKSVFLYLLDLVYTVGFFPTYQEKNVKWRELCCDSKKKEDTSLLFFAANFSSKNVLLTCTHYFYFGFTM